MDAFGIHNFDLQVHIQLEINDIQETEHLCVAGLDIEGRGNNIFLHGFIPA
jgi:hypothetical protein